LAYTIDKIASVISGTALLAEPGTLIEHLLVDSRRLSFPSSSLFFALSTLRKDGSDFIKELHEKGVRNFIVKKGFESSPFADGNFIHVDDPLRALQKIAAYHRRQFDIPVIGITGSNGKTIVKEWLYQLLHNDFKIVRSPKSYNSQIGVPLSVWQINEQHDLAIIEAGISLPHEMEYLEDIIRPTIGVLTNIGEAHREGFESAEQKAFEKAKLFKECGSVIYYKDALLEELFRKSNSDRSSSSLKSFFTWSRKSPADLVILEELIAGHSTKITASVTSTKQELTFEIPCVDRISIDNAVTCLSVMLVLGYTQDNIGDRFLNLSSVEMRMQLKKGVNNCVIINDSYSNDLSSLVLALDYLKAQQGIKKTTAILSDIAESGLDANAQFISIFTHLSARNIDRAILIGPNFFKISGGQFSTQDLAKSIQLEFYSSTNAFLEQSTTNRFLDEVVLLKGARSFEFENISRWLEEKTHQTIMEVNLNAMVHNLKEHQKILQPETKVMAMVKAFSYGSGNVEVANILEFHKVDYLAVAYADEGVELRKAGINMPIMVMNAEPSTFTALIEYNLEPEIYSFNILDALLSHLKQQGITQFPVHLKIDTGMHRLGFEPDEIDNLLSVIKRDNALIIKSVFSHLVASEDASLDQFTNKQARDFENACITIRKYVGYSFTKHLSNSAAIFRHPHLQCDMVRLGIGLYGVAAQDNSLDLQTVATLRTTIAQIRLVKAGESVGYNRKGILSQDSLIATVRIGYADGYSRKFSNGVGKMFINGSLAPVVGNVCMDMTMLNITQIKNIHEGDEVEVFGANLPVQQLGKWADTIPYEILTGISQRIKRVYYEE
jgi:alanine racemase